MRPEAALTKRIRIAVVKDGRARVVPNTPGLVVPYAQIRRALETGDVAALRRIQPIPVGMGKGSPDLVGVLRPSGRVFCLEVKLVDAHAHGQHEIDQGRWHETMRRLGGFVAVVRSTEDAIAAVDRALRGADR